ncbi:MAG: hypothetical protein ACRDNZ_16665, partial [Streptosporangiaceae bacterium]
LVDELPEEEVRPVHELIRRRADADASHSARDLPFFASFESDPDLAERSEEILRAELGRDMLCAIQVSCSLQAT